MEDRLVRLNLKWSSRNRQILYLVSAAAGKWDNQEPLTAETDEAFDGQERSCHFSMAAKLPQADRRRKRLSHGAILAFLICL